MRLSGKPEYLAQNISKLNKNKIYMITEAKNARTIQQNRYLHLIVQAIGQEWGESPDYVKNYLKEKFLTEEVIGKNGITYDRKNTRDLNTKQIKEFIENIRNWALHELQMTIPDPEDQRLEAFYNEYGL